MKNKLLAFLFRGYARDIEETYKSIYEQRIELLSISDAVRDRLKGITPKRILSAESYLTDYLQGLGEEDRLAFLSKASRIVENPTYQKVVEAIILESERKAMLEARDMAEVNFQRATINGINILEDLIDELAKLYREEQQKRERLSEQEKFNPI
jgi:hypothetical protein